MFFLLFLAGASAYCLPSSSNAFLIHLDRVALNNLLHTAPSCAGHTPYESYPNGPVALLTPATEYRLELSYSACGGVSSQSLGDLGQVNVLAWIDWNNNDIFDPSELIVSETIKAANAYASPVLVTGSVVPPPASALSTFLRVMVKAGSVDDEYADPCLTGFVGVVYDFPVWLKNGASLNWCDSVLISTNQPNNEYGWSMLEGQYDLVTATQPTGSSSFFPFYQRQDRYIYLSYAESPTTAGRWTLNNGQGSVWCRVISDQWTPDSWSWTCWNQTITDFVDFPFITVTCLTGLLTPPLPQDLPAQSPVQSVMVLGSFSWPINGVYTYKDLRNGAIHYTRQPHQFEYDDPDPYHLYLVGRMWYIDSDDVAPIITAYTPIASDDHRVNRSWSCCFEYGLLATTWMTWNADVSEWQDDNITIHPITYHVPAQAMCSLNTIPSSCEQAPGCGVCIPSINATVVVNGNTVNTTIPSLYPICTHTCAGKDFGGDEGSKDLLSLTYIIIIAVVGFVVLCIVTILCCFLACRCWRKSAAKASSHIMPQQPGSAGVSPAGGGDAISLVSARAPSSDGMMVIGPLGRPVKVFPAPEGQPLPEGMVPVLLLPVETNQSSDGDAQAADPPREGGQPSES